MHLLAGLGNPGSRYAGNRHNVGFMVIDRMAALHGSPAFRTQFQGRFARTKVKDQDVGLLMPDTFMNLSGRSVQAAMHFFKLPLPEVVVIHDELDLPFGVLRVKVGGGAAGHNGVASVAECCGGPGFVRLRIGIGRPPREGKEHVLADFSRDEGAALGDVLERATSALVDIVVHGAQAAMNVHNRSPA